LADPGRALGKRTGMRYRLYGLGKRTTKTSGLNGSHFVVRSEDLGIPQARHRVILLGVREDLPAEPEPLPSNSIVPAGMVLRDLSPLRSGLSRQQDSPSAWHSAIKRSASRIRAELLKLGASSNRIDEIVDQSCRLNSR